jgi:hypothetical protein
MGLMLNQLVGLVKMGKWIPVSFVRKRSFVRNNLNGRESFIGVQGKSWHSGSLFSSKGLVCGDKSITLVLYSAFS